MSLVSVTLGSRTAQAMPSAEATLSRLQLADLNAAATFVAPPSHAPVVSPAQPAASPGATPGRDQGTTRGDAASTREQIDATNESRGAAPRNPAQDNELNAQQVEQILELAARDREVRVHEQAHQAAGGQYAGAVSYSYVRGPNGQTYATGGEVDIDVAPIAGDLAATIQKMEQVQRAALAPAEPSAQDRAVAAFATQQIIQARAEQARQLKETARTAAGSEATDTDTESTGTASVGTQPSAAMSSSAVEQRPDSRTRRQDESPSAAESGEENNQWSPDPLRARAVEAYQAMLKLGQQLQVSELPLSEVQASHAPQSHAPKAQELASRLNALA